MADDKGGSDLDVFEGLSKKGRAGAQRREQLPVAPATLRGGLGVPLPAPGPTSRPLPPPGQGPVSRPLPIPASQGPVSRPLPPPSRVPTRGKPGSGPGAPEPLPSVPLAAAPPPSGPAVLPKPTPPPSRRMASTPPPAASPVHTPRFSEAPAIAIREDDLLPGSATADLDWDDEEESTHVFADAPELYGDVSQQAGPKRDVGMAAALFKQSGRTAAPVPVMTPAPAPVAHIPAPAPVPREVSTALPTPKVPPPPRSRDASWQAAPAAGRGPMPYVVAALAVLGIIVAVFLFLRGEGKSAGALQIDVVYQGASVDVAEVFIEGQRRCDNTPCTVKDLKPGKYTVKVATRDQGSRIVDVEIVSGIATPIKVDLSGEGPAPDKTSPSPSVAPKTGPASIKLVSKQDGVKVIVGDVEKTTLEKGKPYELKDLKPGTIKLRLVGPNEYAAKELEVEVAAGETKDLGELSLTLLKVRVTFVRETPDAKVTLSNDEDKGSKTLQWKRGEDKLEESLDTSKHWTVVATKKGYIELKQTIVFDDDSPEKTVKIALTKTGEEPPPVVGTATTATPPASTSAPPPPPPPPATSKATISMNSIPPSKVLLDGRPLGETPQSAQVDPGSHTVMFIHKTRGRKQRTVTVSAGQAKVVSVTFKESEGG